MHWPEGDLLADPLGKGFIGAVAAYNVMTIILLYVRWYFVRCDQVVVQDHK